MGMEEGFAGLAKEIFFDHNDDRVSPIKGMFNLQILRGLGTNRSLLSCVEDGTKVDLWSVDDGSGRQRWGIEPIPGKANVYHICVEKGVNNDRRYLSTTIDGSKVDLYGVDDGSGRQQWVITPVTSCPTPFTCNIAIYAGVNGGRKYLSCTNDGVLVDLWGVDDDSGRQRWQLQAIK
ncbi:hypothetical protein [Spirochaeta cellobiosiphila]|uniref:hypothetical protein n=1 Tax=Spirochaeta cellobiosiphila TaxID=504483 RepID=UPI00041256A3|nr:hypothetical protein [Spirochaeta cellobiosiphila]